MLWDGVRQLHYWRGLACHPERSIQPRHAERSAQHLTGGGEEYLAISPKLPQVELDGLYLKLHEIAGMWLSEVFPVICVCTIEY